MNEKAERNELWRVGARIYRVHNWSDGTWALDELSDDGYWVPIAGSHMSEDDLDAIVEVILCQC